ncbi:MAG: PAS domain S-box protein [Halobacteria archaeon]
MPYSLIRTRTGGCFGNTSKKKEFEVVESLDTDSVNLQHGPDLCLIDVGGLDRWTDDVKDIKKKVKPHIPMMLLTEADSFPRFYREVGGWVDQLTRMPIQKESLEGQIESLLHTRELSIELEKARKEAESTLYTLLDSSPDPSLVINGEGEIKEINKAFEEMFSVEDDLVGKPVKELSILPAEEKELVYDQIRGAIEDREPSIKTVSFELDDETKYVEVKSDAVTDQDKVIGAIGIFRDVTEIRKRLEELEILRDRLDLALEETQTGIWEWNLETDKVAWTKSIEKLFDIEIEDTPDKYVLQKSDKNREYRFEEGMSAFVEKIHQEDMEDVEKGIEEVVETGEANYDFRIEGDDGIRWVNCHATKTTNREGQEIVLGVNSDITERKEQSLIQETVFNQAFQFKGLLDLDGRLVKANDQALEFAGIDREDVIGKLFWETYWWQGDEERQQKLKQAIERAAEGEFVRYEVEVEGEDGSSVIDFSLRPVKDRSGVTRYIVPEGRVIDQLKERENELRRTKEKLNLAIENTGTGIWEWDLESDEIDLFGGTESIFGLEKDEFGGSFQNFLDLLHPDDLTEVKESIERYLEDERGIYESEMRVEVGEGDHNWIYCVGELNERDGGSRYLSGVVTEIDEIKNREQELRRKTRAIDEAPVGVIITDPGMEDNPITYVNDAFLELTGCSEDQVLGRNCRFLQGDETSAGKVEMLRQAIDNEEPVTVDIRNYRDSGEMFWNRLSVSPVYDSEGELINFVGFQQDITKQKNNQRRIKEIKNRFEALFKSTPNGIAIANSDGEFVMWNQAMTEIFGYEKEEMVGKPIVEIIPENMRQQHLDSFNEYIDTGEGKIMGETVELVGVDSDGDSFPIEISLSGWEVDGERYSSAIIQDISERKEREQKIKQREQELEARNKDLKLLNRVMRHDIRNDMQIILTVGEYLLEKDTGENKRIEGLIENAVHVVELTESVRGVIEAMSYERDNDLEPIDLYSALQEEITEIGSQEEVEIRADEIPDVKVSANVMLGSVFRNLLKNAVVHNDKDVAEIEVGCNVEDDYVEVSIADNGPGINDEIKEDIFGRGEKGDESWGTGIGLYLVKTLVDLYGGEVSVEDNEPTGAVFRVKLNKAVPEQTISNE